MVTFYFSFTYGVYFMVYKVGDAVVYANFGVYKICEIKSMSFSKSEPEREYYVLEPVNRRNANCYLPTDNEKALSRVRRALSKEELDSILDTRDIVDVEWIEEKRPRMKANSELLESGDARKILGLLKCLYEKLVECEKCGKRFPIDDMRMLTLAKNVIADEFCVAGGIEKEDVDSYIRSRLSK